MKKISSDQVKEAIIKEALSIHRKQQLFEEVKKLSAEVVQLNEAVPAMLGSFGFEAEGDISKKTKTGFVEDGKPKHISHALADLEAELEAMNNEPGFGDQGNPSHSEDRVSQLEEEVTKLKEEIAKLANQ